MKYVVCAALSICVFASLAGCSTSKVAEKDARTAEKAQQACRAKPVTDARPFITDAYGWLPPDTMAIAGSSSDRLWSLVGGLFPKVQGADSAKDAVGTSRAMRDEVGVLLSKRIGVNIAQADAFVVGGSPTWISIVLYGDIDLPEVFAQPEEVSGHRVYRVRIDKFPKVYSPWWAVRFDKPRPGVAIFPAEQLMKAALAAREKADDANKTLADIPSPELADMLDELPPAGMVAVGNINEKSKRMLGRLPFAAPDRVGAALGDKLTLSADGSKRSLDGIEQFVEQITSRANTMLATQHQRVDSMRTAKALSAVMAYHLGMAYLHGLDKKRADGRLTYTEPLPPGRAAAFVPVLAAIAVPAFNKYVKRSKASEAHGITRKMADGAKIYFTSDQHGCDDIAKCREPWHAGTAADEYIEWEQKTFPGGTNVVLRSSPEVPSGGTKYRADAELLKGPKGVDAKRILDLLGVRFLDPMYLQYTYVTGPGTGADATATITAVADFEEGGPKHTVQVKLSIDPKTQNLRVTPPIIFDEFQ